MCRRACVMPLPVLWSDMAAGASRGDGEEGLHRFMWAGPHRNAVSVMGRGRPHGAGRTCAVRAVLSCLALCCAVLCCAVRAGSAVHAVHAYMLGQRLACWRLLLLPVPLHSLRRLLAPPTTTTTFTLHSLASYSGWRASRAQAKAKGSAPCLQGH